MPVHVPVPVPVPVPDILHLAAQVESVATTLALAEQNHAEELKRVCLEFVSKNLSVVMTSEGYQHMFSACPELQVRTTRLLIENDRRLSLLFGW